MFATPRFLRTFVLAFFCLSGLASGATQRAALVIGNSAYAVSPLANPANDAKDMAAALRKLGFDVTEVTNANQREMNRAITAFGSKLRSDSVALFFYAGHGIQAKGKNYLLPVDAEVANEASLRSEGVDVDAVLDQIAATGSQVNIVILDACRNNPFERKFRSAAGGGLAQLDAPKGTLIAYATAPGKVASDGVGKNGLYTSELLRALQQPGAKVEEVFKKVRIEVARNSNDVQIPWESSSLTGDFFFIPPTGGTELSATKPSEPEQLPDTEAWRFAESEKTVAAYAAYAALHPEGRYIDIARLNLDRGIKKLSPEQKRAEIDRLKADMNEAISTRHWRNAIRYAGSLLEFEPKNRTGIVALSTAYLFAGRGNDADRVLTRAIAIDPGFSPFHNLLGAVRERRGDHANARQAYGTACNLGNPTACQNARRFDPRG